LGERGGTPSTGLGWNDLDGWGGIMKRGRRRTMRFGTAGGNNHWHPAKPDSTRRVAANKKEAIS